MIRDKEPTRLLKSSVLALPEWPTVAAPFRIKLDDNESPIELPDEFKEAILEQFRGFRWSHKPEPVPQKLLESLGRYAGHNPSGILIDNGTLSLLRLVALAVLQPGQKVLLPRYSEPFYRQLLLAHEAQLLEPEAQSNFGLDVKAMIQLCSEEKPAMTCFANPHDPSGRLLTRSEIQLLLESAPGLVVIDESYWEFAGVNCASLLSRYDNLLIIRHFSPAFHLGAAQLAYAMGHPVVIAQLRKLQSPGAINPFSAVAAASLLTQPEWLQDTIAYLVAERQRIYYEMVMFPHVKPFASQANFIAFQTLGDVQETLRFLNRYGILITDLSTRYGIPNGARVTIGTEDDNDSFLDALFAAAEQVG